MKILFLTSRLPFPPNRGDRLRVYHFARQLAEEHELTLVSFIRNSEELQHVRDLQPVFREIHVERQPPLRSVLSTAQGLFSQKALQLRYYYSPAMEKRLELLVSRTEFDIVYTHLIRMAPYGLKIKNAVHVLDLTDVISNEIRQSIKYRKLPCKWLYEIELPRLVAAEKLYSGLYEENWVISREEALALGQINPAARVRVVGNGVDFNHFPPKKRQPDSRSLIFVGHMAVFHNIDAAVHLANDILPLLHEEHPDLSLEIIGAQPVKQVLTLEANPSVHVRGYVPNLTNALHQAAIFAAPLRIAAGIQNKVLEAMATATPVVTSSLVNRGIQAQPGTEIIVADDSRTFATALANLLSDPALGREIGWAGYEFVRRNFSWKQVKNAVNNLLQP